MNSKTILAKKYLDCCFNSDFKELSIILVENLTFSGPLLKSNSKDEYLMELKKNPFTNSRYIIKYEFFNHDQVCLVYEIVKNKGDILVTQVFEFDGEKIKKIVTVFDSKEI